MDCGADYIEMCRKAIEIQDIRNDKIVIGDYYDLVVLEGDGIFIVDGKYESKKYLPWCQYYIWLPRQDQLQEIYCNEYEGGMDMWQSFLDFIVNGYEADKYKSKPASIFKTGEQLWLAYVMSKKFNKHWSGSEWITKGDRE